MGQEKGSKREHCVLSEGWALILILILVLVLTGHHFVLIDFSYALP